MNTILRSSPLPLLAFLAACSTGAGLLPAQGSAAPVVTLEAPSNDPPIPVPEAPVGPPFTAAPTVAAPDEDGASKKPDLDCTTFKGGPAPSPRFLCELAMGERPASSLMDGRGYAYVARYGNAGEEGPSEWKVRQRSCGAEAVKNLEELLDEIRSKLGYGAEDPWVSCNGLVCDVRAEGEWSTPQRLYFRQTAQGPVLEAWTRIEVALVDAATVTARQAWIEQGRRALAGRSCGR